MFLDEPFSRKSGRYGLVILFAVAIYACLYIHCCDGQGLGRGNRRGNRPRNNRRGPGGMDPEVRQAYLDLHQQRPQTTQTSPMWAALAPSVPVGDDVECHVEIVQVRPRGGRCVRLGGNASRPYICQSGDQIEISTYCQRQAQQDDGPHN